MKLTALIENQAPDGLLQEHGLSVWIEYDGHTLLLDSGASDAFGENARRLGLDLGRVELSALSHGHFDHSGGFRALFAANPDVKVLMRRGADGENCDREGDTFSYIGIPRDILGDFPQRFLSVDGDFSPLPGVWLLPDGVPDLEARSRRAGMFRRVENAYLPEDFCHEQTLVLEGKTGLVALNSCSHAGVPGIVKTVLDRFPGRRISGFFGGFHMMGAQGACSLGWTEEAVRAEARALNALPVDVYYTCHCTGTPAFALLREELGDRVRYFRTGDSVTLD